MKISFGKLSLIMLFTIFGLSSCNKGKQTKAQKQDKIHVVEKGTIVVKLEETGEIEPIKTVEIKSKVSGKVTRILVAEGDFVNEGDVIAEIEPDYNQAETISRVKKNLELASIRLENAEKDRNEKLELYKKEYISENVFDSVSDELKRAQLEYATALNDYDLIKEIETENSVSKIISGASGTVIQKPVEVGEMVVSSTGSYSAGTVILRLADLKRMIVKTHINEVDISKIEKDQGVKIQVDAYPYKDYFGNISKIASMAIDYNNVKAFPIEIEIEKVDDKLKPGMTANITIIGEKRENIVVVPIRCLFLDDEGNDIIYKVVNDTISTSKKVKTGINDFQKVEIIQGIALGDSISYSEPKKKNEDLDIKFK